MFGGPVIFHPIPVISRRKIHASRTVTWFRKWDRRPTLGWIATDATHCSRRDSRKSLGILNGRIVSRRLLKLSFGTIHLSLPLDPVGNTTVPNHFAFRLQKGFERLTPQPFARNPDLHE